jgi:hypothetical protein
LAIKAIKCATQLNGLRVITVGGRTVKWDFHVFKSNPNWALNLRTWGEAGNEQIVLMANLGIVAFK